MFRVEMVSIKNLRIEEYNYHYDLLNPSETYDCVIYISDALDNLLKQYIPTGIKLLDQSTAKILQNAISDIYDKISEQCHAEFDYKKQTAATLENLKYAFNWFKVWSEYGQNAVFRVFEV